MRLPSKLLVYLALIVGAVAFVVPFAWMALTALKPLNQTMGQSQSWLPRRFEAQLGGRLQEVAPGAAITEPSVWALQQGASQPVVLAEKSVQHGAWQPASGAPLPIVVLKRIPASASSPWIEIGDLKGLGRDVVPLRRIKDQWMAFGKRLAHQLLNRSNRQTHGCAVWPKQTRMSRCCLR